jgi:hypothetical protein
MPNRHRVIGGKPVGRFSASDISPTPRLFGPCSGDSAPRSATFFRNLNPESQGCGARRSRDDRLHAAALIGEGAAANATRGPVPFSVMTTWLPAAQSARLARHDRNTRVAVFQGLACLTPHCATSRNCAIHRRFIALLKVRFKISIDYRGAPQSGLNTTLRLQRNASAREAMMGRTELAMLDGAGSGQASADLFLRLGMMYSTGTEVPTDYVSAHKWFNLAASRGNAEAIRLRREVAVQMSDDEIAMAQRAARDWLRQ